MCPYDNNELRLLLLLELSLFSRPLSSEVTLFLFSLCRCLFSIFVCFFTSLLSFSKSFLFFFFTHLYFLTSFINSFHPSSTICSSSLRPVRTGTRSIWSTSSSMGPILPPRMPLETLPCTSVLYTTRYTHSVTEIKSQLV